MGQHVETTRASNYCVLGCLWAHRELVVKASHARALIYLGVSFWVARCSCRTVRILFNVISVAVLAPVGRGDCVKRQTH